MNTQQTKSARRCRSETSIRFLFVASFAIIGVSAAACAVIGAIIGAVMNDMISGFVWGGLQWARVSGGVVMMVLSVMTAFSLSERR